jgi:hypothetical protein
VKFSAIARRPVALPAFVQAQRIPRGRDVCKGQFLTARSCVMSSRRQHRLNRLRIIRAPALVQVAFVAKAAGTHTAPEDSFARPWASCAVDGAPGRRRRPSVRHEPSCPRICRWLRLRFLAAASLATVDAFSNCAMAPSIWGTRTAVGVSSVKKSGADAGTSACRQRRCLSLSRFTSAVRSRAGQLRDGYSPSKATQNRMT